MLYSWKKLIFTTLVCLAALLPTTPARALTVLCWGGGIPCFHVSNCGGYPACTGGNQPCCLGGSATAFGGVTSYSDHLQTTPVVVESLEITSELSGMVVLDLFIGGKLVDERVYKVAGGSLPLKIDIAVKGVTADYFRLYIDQNTAKEVLPGGFEREAIAAPVVYHFIKASARTTAEQRKTMVTALGSLQRVSRLEPDLVLDQEGTAIQCK